MKKKVTFGIICGLLIICVIFFVLNKYRTNTKNTEMQNENQIHQLRADNIKKEDNETLNKTAIFFGDSITAGFGSKSGTYSWANFIGEEYDLKASVNAGLSDYRVSTYDDANKWLVTQVKNHYNDEIVYDYIIMQGGINDVFYDTPLGIFSPKGIEDYDQNTFAGGLELYIHAVIDKWPNAKIGYIITYYTPNYFERGINWSFDDYKEYYDLTKKILDKYNISYLDLFEGRTKNESYNDILSVDTTRYLPDKLHLNDDGYRIISPYIYAWMKTIKPIQVN